MGHTATGIAIAAIVVMLTIALLRRLTSTPLPGPVPRVMESARNSPQLRVIVESAIGSGSAHGGQAETDVLQHVVGDAPVVEEDGPAPDDEVKGNPVSDDDAEVIECVICAESITRRQFRDGQAAGCFCPRDVRTFRHDTTECRNTGRCGHDARRAFGRVFSLDDDPVERTWSVDRTSASWALGHGVAQGLNNSSLCYAAATATASNCAGVPTTRDECIHRFAMSDQASHYPWAEDYRTYYAAARDAIGGTPTVDQVHQRMGQNPTWDNRLYQALNSFGSPIFPPGVNNVVTYAMDWDGIQTRVNAGRVIMAGTDDHWRVIYGYRQESGGQQRRFLKLYDPRPDVVREEYEWPAPEFGTFVTVG